LDPNMPSYRTFWLNVEANARNRGMAVQAVELREAGELAGAFARMVKDRAQAIQLVGSPFFYSVRCQIAELAGRRRLPTAFPWREGPEEGGLLSYGANLRAAWHRAAVYVDKILKGAKPADLPIEQPTTFELIINLKTAKVLGLGVPRPGRWRELVNTDADAYRGSGQGNAGSVWAEPKAWHGRPHSLLLTLPHCRPSS
jgi:putative ABC transport system substrate-binding protein